MVIVGVQGKFGMESEPGGWVTQAPRGPQEGAPRTGVKLFPSSERVRLEICLFCHNQNNVNFNKIKQFNY